MRPTRVWRRRRRSCRQTRLDAMFCISSASSLRFLVGKSRKKEERVDDDCRTPHRNIHLFRFNVAVGIFQTVPRFGCPAIWIAGLCPDMLMREPCEGVPSQLLLRITGQQACVVCGGCYREGAGVGFIVHVVSSFVVSRQIHVRCDVALLPWRAGWLGVVVFCLSISRRPHHLSHLITPACRSVRTRLIASLSEVAAGARSEADQVVRLGKPHCSVITMALHHLPCDGSHLMSHPAESPALVSLFRLTEPFCDMANSMV